MRGFRSGVVFLLLLVPARVGSGQDAVPDVLSGRRELRWVRIEDALDLDLRALTPRGRALLDDAAIDWEHAETPHFVLHFERAMFARKVARMAEFFYAYIAHDIQSPEDRVSGRSHIFIFRSPDAWRAFQASSGGTPEWAFSLVEGTVMYLRQAEDTESSGSVLAHEMTHLVLNRFFPRPPPMWLNEGLAEWYGVFAYAAFKGVKKSKRSSFKRLSVRYPLEALLQSRAYPEKAAHLQAFYETAKFVVAYLRLDWPEDRFRRFLKDIIRGEEMMAALNRHYGVRDVGALEAGFADFIR